MAAAEFDARRFLRLNPLVVVGAIFIVGLVSGRAWEVPVWALLGLAAAALGGWVFFELRLGGRGRRLAGASLGLAICLAAAAMWGINQRQVPQYDLARFLTSDRPVFVTAHCRVATEPVLRERPSDEPAFLGVGTTSCLVETTEIFTDVGWTRASGSAVLNIRGDLPLQRGQLIEVNGFAKRPSGPLIPGEFDFARYLAAARVFVMITATRPMQIAVIDDHARPSLLESFRRNIRGKLKQHLIPRDEVAGQTLAALLLGQRDPAIESMGRAFTAAGAAHLLAISGAHIVIVAMVVWWVLRWIIRRPQMRTLVTIGVVLLYVAATPCGPPILRAAIAAVALAAGRFARRPGSAANLLAAATIIVLAVCPGDMLDAGFQLSFGCTAGLIFFADRVHRGLFLAWLERRGRIARAIGTAWAHRRQRARQYFTQAISANIVGATVAAPLVAFHFHQANPWGVISGLVLFPLVALTMGAGALQLFAEVLGGWIAELTAQLATGMTSVMIAAVGLMADLPGACIALRAPPVWLVLLVYAVVLLWAVRRSLKVSRSRVVLAGVAVLAVAAGWYTLSQQTAPRLAVLAMGKGSAMVLETPGRTVVIDAGATRRDPTQRIIDPFLRARGIGSVDTLVLGHIDRAHSSGGLELADLYHPRAVLVSSADVRRRGFAYAVSEFFDRAERRHLRQVPLSAGGRFEIGPGIACEALWPPDGLMTTLPATDSGLILRLTIERRQVLILDSAGEAALAYVMGGGPDMRADAVILTGAPPSPDMLAQLGVLGARVTICSDTGVADPSLLSLTKMGQIDLEFLPAAIEAHTAGQRLRF